MMNVNEKVKEAITEAICKSGMSIEDLCKAAKLNPIRFQAAMAGESEFNRKDIISISSALNLKDNEIRSIFFPDVTVRI